MSPVTLGRISGSSSLLALPVGLQAISGSAVERLRMSSGLLPLAKVAEELSMVGIAEAMTRTGVVPPGLGSKLETSVIAGLLNGKHDLFYRPIDPVDMKGGGTKILSPKIVREIVTQVTISETLGVSVIAVTWIAFAALMKLLASRFGVGALSVKFTQWLIAATGGTGAVALIMSTLVGAVGMDAVMAVVSAFFSDAKFAVYYKGTLLGIVTAATVKDLRQGMYRKTWQDFRTAKA